MPILTYALAGSYTIYWRHQSSSSAAVALGQTEDGIELEFTGNYEPITGDQYGDSIIDGVYRGGNLYLSMVLLEANQAAVRQLIWPHMGASGLAGLVAPSTELSVGQLAQDNEGQIYLDAIAGPPAASENTVFDPPIKFGRCTIAPNFPVRLALATKLRRVPVRLLAMPYVSSGSTYWFENQATIPT